MESPGEKVARPSRDTLSLCLTSTRFWQWSSSVAIFVFVNFFTPQTVLEDNLRLRAIEPLVCITLAYSSLIIVCVAILTRFRNAEGSTRPWLLYAMMSIPGDTIMLSIFVAKVAVVAIQYYECCAVVKTKQSLSMELERRDDAAEKVVAPSYHKEVGDPKPSFTPDINIAGCYFPKAVYALAIFAIFSYILSIILTVLQIYRLRRGACAVEAGPYRGHVTAFVPQSSSRPSMIRIRPTPVCENLPTTHQPYRSENGAGPSCRSISVDRLDDPKYANMPHGIIASMTVATIGAVQDVVGRISSETTSSFNPDLYLISDGFRQEDAPPEYTSRPSSLYGCP